MRRLSPEFWSSPAVAGALAGCDFSMLLEEIRRARGWTQAELASQVGYSQSWVSKVLRRKQVLNLDQAREVSRRLGIPASVLMIGLADQLWAVWDGKPARGYGGTADVVDYARDHGVPVLVVWPAGARRD